MGAKAAAVNRCLVRLTAMRRPVCGKNWRLGETALWLYCEQAGWLLLNARYSM